MITDLDYPAGELRSVAILIFCQGMAINLDHGALPAALNVIMEELDLLEVQMGCLSSLIFFGLVIGSAAATVIIEKF